MERMLCAFLVLALSTHVTQGHVCILEPRQRGPLDISTAGSHTCTRHTPPCGGQPVEMPRVVYTAGQTVFIHWQQNLNHYEPGYPGYMDVSIADSPTSTDFKTLAVISDKYVFAQWHQENFTALVGIYYKGNHIIRVFNLGRLKLKGSGYRYGPVPLDLGSGGTGQYLQTQVYRYAPVYIGHRPFMKRD